MSSGKLFTAKIYWKMSLFVRSESLEHQNSAGPINLTYVIALHCCLTLLIVCHSKIMNVDIDVWIFINNERDTDTSLLTLQKIHSKLMHKSFSSVYLEKFLQSLNLNKSFVNSPI